MPDRKPELGKPAGTGAKSGGLLVVGDGPGAAEVAQAARELGLEVAVAGDLRDRGGRRCVLAPPVRPLLPDWWTARPATSPTGVHGPVLVAGGGHSGVEAALDWAGRAAGVVLVEAAGRLLPGWDADVAAHVAAVLAGLGVRVEVGCRVVALSSAPGGAGLTARLRRRGQATDTDVAAGLAVPALGLRPDFPAPGPAGTRALADRLGFLQVDSRLETAEPGLHALGAAVALPLTAPAVDRQALVVAACAAGQPVAPVRFHLLPRVISGGCEALTAGLTARQARERGYRPACGRAGDACAWVACVRDAETGVPLGVHAAGEGAATLADAAVRLLEGAVVAAGPTAGDAAQEAALARLSAAFAAATEECSTDD